MIEQKTEHGRMFLLPPAAHLCQTCATEHLPEEPHNAQSLYYQTAFNMQHGRAATWTDAMEHCTPDVRAMWREELIDLGVNVDAGQIVPARS